MMKSAGMITLLAASMPERRPRISTTAHIRITAAVHPICSRKDRAENPSSGGRITDGSMEGTNTDAASASPKYSTQPTTAV